MEMMIVIAIIVILVAISIPTFSGSLEKANKATDEANLRAAKAAHLTQKMNGDFEKTKSYYYDYKVGQFVEGDADDAEANKSTGSCSEHTGDYIVVTVDANGVVSEVKWSDGSDTCDGTVPDTSAP